MTIAKFINEVGFKVREGDVKKVNGTISNIKNTAAKLLGAIGIGFSLTQINALVEEFGRVNEQVKNSTAALGDQAEDSEENHGVCSANAKQLRGNCRSDFRPRA